MKVLMLLIISFSAEVYAQSFWNNSSDQAQVRAGFFGEENNDNPSPQWNRPRPDGMPVEPVIREPRHNRLPFHSIVRRPRPDGLPVEPRIPPNPRIPACAGEGKPVCGVDAMPPCPEGLSCPTVMPRARTFANLCRLKEAGATLIHESACSNNKNEEEPVRGPDTRRAYCPTIYQPVCGQPAMGECPSDLSCSQVMPAAKTYSNACVMGQEGATLVSQGECGADDRQREPASSFRIKTRGAASR